MKDLNQLFDSVTYEDMVKENYFNEKLWRDEVFNFKIGTRIHVPLELSGIPRKFELVDIVDEVAQLTVDSNEYLIESGRYYQPNFNKTCVFILFNIHEEDRYVKNSNRCYCSLEVWERLQRCEACVLECVSATDGCFIVDRIVSTVCEEASIISKQNKCDISHIPYKHSRLYINPECEVYDQLKFKKAIRNVITKYPSCIIYSYMDENELDIRHFKSMYKMYIKDIQTILDHGVFQINYHLILY